MEVLEAGIAFKNVSNTLVFYSKERYIMHFRIMSDLFLIMLLIIWRRITIISIYFEKSTAQFAKHATNIHIKYVLK